MGRRKRKSYNNNGSDPMPGQKTENDDTQSKDKPIPKNNELNSIEILASSTAKKSSFTKNRKRRRRNRNKKNNTSIIADEDNQHDYTGSENCNTSREFVGEEEENATNIRNCYNEVIRFMQQNSYESNYVYESWLMDIRWIKQSKEESNVDKSNGDLACSTTTFNHSTPYRRHYSNESYGTNYQEVKEMEHSNNNDGIHNNIIPTEIDIKNLQNELNNVKSQLQPACKQYQQKHKKKRMTESKLFEMARNTTNPFESLGTTKHSNLNIFLNRSAMKLANINSVLNHTLLTPNKTKDYVFVDLCGAPGGFSEYILHTLTTQYDYDSIFGFGMSLQNEIPWKIQDAIPKSKTKIEYKICNGIDNTGDINNWSNILHLQKNAKKAQLVVADGGINQQRNSKQQEEITIPLFISQVSAASLLLQQNGNFVIKSFGCQTLVVKQIMYFLIQSFEKVTVVKPISSRPASLERYVVCYGWKCERDGDEVLVWRNRMMGLYDASVLSSCEDLYKEDVLVSNYLNRIDYDILQLNTQVCRAILSYLGYLDNQEESTTSKITVNTNSMACYSSFINIDLYRKAWRFGENHFVDFYSHTHHR